MTALTELGMMQNRAAQNSISRETHQGPSMVEGSSPRPADIPDAWWEPVAEGALILIVGVVSLAVGLPLLFTSLGPTAYEQVARPNTKPARPYHVIVGHLVGLGAGFFAVAVLGAWNEPKVISEMRFTPPRVWACTIAVALTVTLMIALRARQPAALTTTLLVAMGAFQTLRSAIVVIGGVLVLAALGEPVRRFRLRRAPQPRR